MNRNRLCALLLPLFLLGCQAGIDDRGTIAQLRHMKIDIQEEQLVGGLEKAIESYQRFLAETPHSALTPEAIRRLADLKVEKEYGHFADGAPAVLTQAALPAPERVAPAETPLAVIAATPALPDNNQIQGQAESDADFEKRTTDTMPAADVLADAQAPEGADDLERAGTLEAIELYNQLLADYPLYERNDQVLYQMSRAYEELGRIEEAMAVMGRLVVDFPRSHYLDEVQFRRAEYFFTHRRYLDAEDAYTTIVKIGVSSSFYDLALYKLGWTFYKQDLYEEALHNFIALLDYKVSVGYEFAQTEDEQERKRMEDTFRVISLSFSNLGGADAVVEYFAAHGKRSYEDSVYSNLGEFYFDKRRYNDATATYSAFMSRNPFHVKSPHFHMRVIDIHAAGGFPSLVLEAKKEFATNYGLQAEYWQHFQPSACPEVLGYLKTNLADLANHYHALYQDQRHLEEKAANFGQALHWYREFLVSFPNAGESPTINYQLADLLLENQSFDQAAVEYEKTAYAYPAHEQSSTAGYAAVYAFRQHLAVVPPAGNDQVRREVVRSSLKFAETFPAHDKAAIVLGAAADDLFGMQEHEQAAAVAYRLIESFPGADTDVTRSAWLVVGHSSYELQRYAEAESAYVKVLDLLPAAATSRAALVDNLAAAIYKQGEQANALGDFRAAADHLLRVGRMAPTSKIRPTAEYDAAAALIQLKDWQTAASVLVGFRDTFPGHELQPEVTKKIAYVYREDGQLALAANEFERIERESRDQEVRREALMVAAELHEEAGNAAGALVVYRRYVDYFPQPLELNLETRNKIAGMLKAANQQGSYLDELRQIVAIDGAAGSSRTDRTRYLAAKAALVLAEPGYARFTAVSLEQPFEVNLRKKRDLMKTAMQEFSKLLEYQVGEVTAAATFYLAEINAHFSRALTESERPAGLSAVEREEYELAIEEQAYPFEEQAIAVHESNLKLIGLGIYNQWIDRSLQKLAEFVPARYARPEQASGIINSLESYTFAWERPVPPQAAPATPEPTVQADNTEPEVTEDGTPRAAAAGADLSAQADTAAQAAVTLPASVGQGER
jgi:tetratricopeptide (TPR) repeat protein